MVNLINVTVENVDLEIEYYFGTPFDEDEQQLETLHIDAVKTSSGDDITELMWHHNEKIAIAVYRKLGYDIS